MPRFFVRQDRLSGDNISIIGEDAHHIARSLRMAVGEQITVCDMQGNEYECEILEFDEDKEVIVRITSSKRSETEPKIYIRLFQALPKGDKLDTIIQKAVECGASEIIPFQSDRCIVKIKGEAEAKKKERRQRIAAEAAKQCGRSVIPEIKDAVRFDEALLEAEKSELCLFCYEGDDTQGLRSVLGEYKGDIPKTVSVFIGSEGGFSINEASRARDADMKMVGLGRRILRTETASSFVLACLVYESEL